MKILVILPPFSTIPAKGQGGTERIAEGMVNEFVKLGHEVTLFGAGQSQTPAKFISLIPTPISQLKTDSTTVEASRPLRVETAYISMVMKHLLDTDGQYDVVFSNMRGESLLLPVAEKIKAPIITILHLPLFEELIEAFKQFDRKNLVSISNSQRKPAEGQIEFLRTVYNGMDLNEFPFCEKPEEYVLFVGAMAEHKSPHLAIEAAKEAGVKIKLAGGKIREPYFTQTLKPLIDNDQVVYLGEVSGQDRVNLFSQAKALLMPITWEEPFGLVMIEAMAGGTPVIGFRHGAVEEVVDDGATGFVVDDSHQMAEAIGKIDQIDRQKCRQKVEQNYTYEVMAKQYLEATKEAK